MRRAGLGVALLIASAGASAQSAAPGSPHDDVSGSLLDDPRFKLDDCASEEQQNDIVVCGKKDRASRYLLPLHSKGFDPKGEMESVSRERNKLLEGGESGIGSCSTVGAGGATGCLQQGWKREYQQRAGRKP